MAHGIRHSINVSSIFFDGCIFDTESTTLFMNAFLTSSTGKLITLEIKNSELRGVIVGESRTTVLTKILDPAAVL